VPDKTVYSWPHIAISAIGGLAAAVVFAAVARGGFGGLLLGHLAPLPLMIVAIGFGLGHGVTAAILAVAILSIWLHPMVGMGYALVVAIPAWLGSWAACGAPINRRDRITGHLPGWAALAPAATLIFVCATWLLINTYISGNFDEAMSFIRGKLFLMIDAAVKAQPEDQRAGLDPDKLSGLVAFALPGFFAAYYTMIHFANLWIAGRLAQASALLKRPWPDIALEFYLPRAVVPLFGIGVGLAFVGGLAHAVGLVIAAPLGLLLACQGLAVVHDMVREMRSGVVVLGILYFVLGLLGFPMLPLAVLGSADVFFDYRARRKAKKDVQPTNP